MTIDNRPPIGTGVIDTATNLFTAEVAARRPPWTQSTFLDNREVPAEYAGGVDLKAQVELMAAAGVGHALLTAPKVGRQGLPGAWQLDAKTVLAAVDEHPRSFSAQVGIDPYDGMKGVRELSSLVRDHNVVGAHCYPHWFDLPPDHRKFYPFYSKCAELGIPIQIQVGSTLRYPGLPPVRNVGRPLTLDTVACDFPELKIVATHLGWPWVEELIAVSYKHPNVFISAESYRPKYWPAEFTHFVNSWGSAKVLFASMWPTMSYSELMAELAELELRPASLQRFLSSNAASLYGLPVGQPNSEEHA